MSGAEKPARSRRWSQPSAMAPAVAATSGAPKSQVSRKRMPSSMPFHIAPPAISTEKESATPRAISARTPRA